MPIIPYFRSNDRNFTLLKGDCRVMLKQFTFKFDMIFADPPYFLSNNGISIQSGKVVSVNKGEWDKSNGYKNDLDFNMEWIASCRDKLTDGGTIWISSSYHNIGMILTCLRELNYKILNVIVWEKTNPPQNISCRYFTYSTEFIVWARRSEKVPHYFNYDLMKALNGGKQMKDVWRLPAIAPWEKTCTKHPTQKPLSLLTRIIQASTKPNGWILDPFAGSSTTGIAANLYGRRYLGIERETNYLDISIARKHEIEETSTANSFIKKIAKTNEKDMADTNSNTSDFVNEDFDVYSRELPF